MSAIKPIDRPPIVVDYPCLERGREVAVLRSLREAPGTIAEVSARVSDWAYGTISQTLATLRAAGMASVPKVGGKPSPPYVYEITPKGVAALEELDRWAAERERAGR